VRFLRKSFEKKPHGDVDVLVGHVVKGTSRSDLLSRRKRTRAASEIFNPDWDVVCMLDYNTRLRGLKK
jgi:hypothetical protein